MKTHIWTRVTIALLAVVVAAGCASTGGGGAAALPSGPSDEEMIQSLVADAMEALAAKDITTMVSAYADDFSDDNGDKQAAIDFLQGAADQGFLDGLEIDQSALTIEVDGDNATAGPINLEGAFGAIGLTFDLQKRDGKWWVVSQTQSM